MFKINHIKNKSHHYNKDSNNQKKKFNFCILSSNSNIKNEKATN